MRLGRTEQKWQVCRNDRSERSSPNGPFAKRSVTRPSRQRTERTANGPPLTGGPFVRSVVRLPGGRGPGARKFRRRRGVAMIMPIEVTADERGGSGFLLARMRTLPTSATRLRRLWSTALARRHGELTAPDRSTRCPMITFGRSGFQNRTLAGQIVGNMVNLLSSGKGHIQPCLMEFDFPKSSDSERLPAFSMRSMRWPTRRARRARISCAERHLPRFVRRV
jgi:hypothetical protein